MSIYLRKQMDEKSKREQAYVNEYKTTRPDAKWSLYPNSRAEKEAQIKAAKKADMVAMLGSQVREHKQVNEREHSREVEIGREMVQADLKMAMMDKTMRDFKQACFSKEMREAWQDQAQYKKHMKEI
jgi:hypothetical protein